MKRTVKDIERHVTELLLKQREVELYSFKERPPSVDEMDEILNELEEITNQREELKKEKT